MTLDAAIAAFARTHRKWEDPARAAGECDEAAAAFVAFCAAQGIEAETRTYRRTERYLPDEMRALFETATDRGHCDAHTVAVVGGMVVDWTASQYDEGAPFPLTYQD